VNTDFKEKNLPRFLDSVFSIEPPCLTKPLS
jgi:hypothetical protein